MKKRLIKKWIKRYLHDQVKDLPRIETYKHYEYTDIGDGLVVQKVYTTRSIVNGHIVHEGSMYPRKTNARLDIMRTAKLLSELISKSDKTFLRVYPEYSRGYIYVRVATEVVK